MNNSVESAPVQKARSNGGNLLACQVQRTVEFCNDQKLLQWKDQARVPGNRTESSQLLYRIEFLKEQQTIHSKILSGKLADGSV